MWAEELPAWWARSIRGTLWRSSEWRAPPAADRDGLSRLVWEVAFDLRLGGVGGGDGPRSDTAPGPAGPGAVSDGEFGGQPANEPAFSRDAVSLRRCTGWQ